MAQPRSPQAKKRSPNAQTRPSDEKEPGPDGLLKEELRNLEKKFRDHVQRRNDLNTQSRALRDERDLLNNARKQLGGKLKELAAKRDALNDEMRQHKAIRNEAQAQAKALIATKQHKKEKGGQSRSSVLRARELRAQIADMEFKQQTTPMDIAKEREFLKKLKALAEELKGLDKDIQEYKELKVDLSDTDQAIDTLFAKADEQHKLVSKFYKEASAVHQEFIKVLEEAKVVGSEANAKHQASIETRERAQAEHLKADEMRKQIMEIKGQVFAHRKEARDAIRETQKAVRENLLDKQKLEENAESTLEQLKKGGKITLG